MSKHPEQEQLLKQLGVTPDKAFGQNFIHSAAVIDEILRFAKPHSSDHLVEIGPGLGALTSELITVAPLTAIEIEPSFCEYLKKTFPDLNIHNEDFRNCALEELGSELTIFGNIPYSFSSDILFTLLDTAAAHEKRVIKRAILLVQKEFAERVASPPGSKAYGVPSVRTALLANTRLGPCFPGTVFHPPASVESQVLEIRFLETPRCEVQDPLHLKLLLATAFGTRRRKILNSLTTSAQYPAEHLDTALKAASLTPEQRVETIAPEQFAILSNTLLELSPATESDH